MNNPDFAELKEKLTEWTEQSMNEIFDLCSNDCSNNNSEMPCAVTGAQYQHAKSAAIITELLEIIQIQSEALESCGCFCGSFDFDKLACISCSALSETTTRLQKLREGK